MLRLRLCSSCAGTDTSADRLAHYLDASDLSPQVQLERISCGDVCAKPVRLWMQHKNGASYVFEGLDLDVDADDILATARACLAAPDGWIEDARPCGRLRFCLTARIPS